MMPPIKLMVSLFSNVQPILKLMSEHKGITQTFGTPEIIKKEIDGKDVFVVIEKTGFGSEKDARIYIDIADRFHAIKF